MVLLTDTFKKIRSDGTRKVGGAVSQAASLARRRRLSRLRRIVWLAGFVIGGSVAAAVVWYLIARSREDG